MEEVVIPEINFRLCGIIPVTLPSTALAHIIRRHFSGRQFICAKRCQYGVTIFAAKTEVILTAIAEVLLNPLYAKQKTSNPDLVVVKGYTTRPFFIDPKALVFSPYVTIILTRELARSGFTIKTVYGERTCGGTPLALDLPPCRWSHLRIAGVEWDMCDMIDCTTPTLDVPPLPVPDTVYDVLVSLCRKFSPASCSAIAAGRQDRCGCSRDRPTLDNFTSNSLHICNGLMRKTLTGCGAAALLNRIFTSQCNVQERNDVIAVLMDNIRETSSTREARLIDKVKRWPDSDALIAKRNLYSTPAYPLGTNQSSTQILDKDSRGVQYRMGKTQTYSGEYVSRYVVDDDIRELQRISPTPTVCWMFLIYGGVTEQRLPFCYHTDVKTAGRSITRTPATGEQTLPFYQRTDDKTAGQSATHSPAPSLCPHESASTPLGALSNSYQEYCMCTEDMKSVMRALYAARQYHTEHPKLIVDEAISNDASKSRTRGGAIYEDIGLERRVNELIDDWQRMWPMENTRFCSLLYADPYFLGHAITRGVAVCQLREKECGHKISKGTQRDMIRCATLRARRNLAPIPPELMINTQPEITDDCNYRRKNQFAVGKNANVCNSKSKPMKRKASKTASLWDSQTNAENQQDDKTASALTKSGLVASPLMEKNLDPVRESFTKLKC